MATSRPRASSLSGKRYSASGEASRAEEKARIWRMTLIERMALALSLGRRRQALLALRAKQPSGHE